MEAVPGPGGGGGSRGAALAEGLAERVVEIGCLQRQGDV